MWGHRPPRRRGAQRGHAPHAWEAGWCQGLCHRRQHPRASGVVPGNGEPRHTTGQDASPCSRQPGLPARQPPSLPGPRCARQTPAQLLCRARPGCRAHRGLSPCHPCHLGTAHAVSRALNQAAEASLVLTPGPPREGHGGGGGVPSGGTRGPERSRHPASVGGGRGRGPEGRKRGRGPPCAPRGPGHPPGPSRCLLLKSRQGKHAQNAGFSPKPLSFPVTAASTHQQPTPGGNGGRRAQPTAVPSCCSDRDRPSSRGRSPSPLLPFSPHPPAAALPPLSPPPPPVAWRAGRGVSAAKMGRQHLPGAR